MHYHNLMTKRWPRKTIPSAAAAYRLHPRRGTEMDRDKGNGAEGLQKDFHSSEISPKRGNGEAMPSAGLSS